MKKLSLATAFLLGATFALAAGAAHATGNQRAAQRVWNEADKCSKLAFEKFPDYTPEDTAKRDAYTRRCVNNKNLPGRSSGPAKQ